MKVPGEIITLVDCELADAIERGELPDVERALRRGASFGPDPREGVLPLHRAVIQQDESIVFELLCAGADPSQADDNGANALDVAATLDSVAIVATLIAFGAPLDGRSDEGYTPLMSAAGRSPKIAMLLVSMGADVRAISEDGKTALGEALSLGDLETARVIFAALDAAAAKTPVNDAAGRRTRRPASSSL